MEGTWVAIIEGLEGVVFESGGLGGDVVESMVVVGF